MNYRLWGLCLIASACASTTMSSLVAPELGGRSFHFVLVIAAFSDVGVMRATEDRFASASGKEVRFVQSYGVFFPGRNYTTRKPPTSFTSAASTRYWSSRQNKQGR